MKQILIVVDMQNDFIDGALGTKEAVAIIDDVVQEIKNPLYTHIYATMDTHQENYMTTMEGKHLPVPHCIKGTDGWQIRPDILDALRIRNAKIIEKPTFGSLELQEVLQDLIDAETEITLIGLCTDICVVTNALLLKTRYPEIEINVRESCMAGVTPESHQAALKTMAMCQINLK